MKIRVLVAEDHPLVREGVIRALERDPGIEVIGEADNGVTAMELGRTLKPDVVVLDLRMPGLGGAVVLERLRAVRRSAPRRRCWLAAMLSPSAWCPSPVIC